LIWPRARGFSGHVEYRTRLSTHAAEGLSKGGKFNPIGLIRASQMAAGVLTARGFRPARRAVCQGTRASRFRIVE